MTDYRDDTPFDASTTHSVEEIARAIRTKKYGIDTREAMAQSIEKMGDIAKQNSAGQVIATPSGVFQTLSELQSKYPSGTEGVFLVVESGHKYIYTNGSWQDAGIYQSAGIADYSINDKKIISPIIATEKTENYVSKDNLIYGKYFAFQTLKEVDNPDFAYIKISVTSGEKLHIYGTTEQMCFVDGNNTLIKSFVGAQYFAENADTSTGLFIGTVPSGASFAYINFLNKNVKKSLVSKNDISFVASDVVAPQAIGVGTITSDKLSEVTVSSKSNYYTPKGLSDGVYVVWSSGQLYQNADFSATDYIRIDPRVKWTVTGNDDQQLAVYDEFKHYLMGFTTSEAFSNADLPATARYIRVSVPNENLNKVEIYPQYEFRREWVEEATDSVIEDKVVPMIKATVTPTIHIGAGQEYTTLKAGLEEAIQHPNTTVIVHPGTYDVIEEYGTEYLDSLTKEKYDALEISSRGLPLGNGMKVIFMNGAKVECHYKGGNEIVETLFSCFYNYPVQAYIHKHADIEGFTLINAHVNASRIHYIVHDDLGLYRPKTSIQNKFYRNNFELDNTNSDFEHKSTCIGGGLTYDQEVVISDNQFIGANGYTTVSYHNHAMSGSEGNIVIKNNYFGVGNTIQIISNGQQDNQTNVLINGNSLGKEIHIDKFNEQDQANMTVKAWNNEIRNEV